MTISIIIPVYNVEHYIRRCLESVIEQKSDDFNIECIMVDDSSPDRSVEIAQDVINSYKGSGITFILLRHKFNKGVSAARNTGIAAASGDFLYFVDSDDEIAEKALQFLFTCFIEYPYVDVFVGDTYEEEHQKMVNQIFLNNRDLFLIDDKAHIWEYVLKRKIDRHVWNKLIRRSIIIDNRIFFDENVTIYEDVIWTYRLFSHSSSILIMSLMTYKYESNPASLTHTTVQHVDQLVESLAIVSEYVLTHPPIVNGRVICYAAHSLFTCRWLMIAIEAADKKDLYNESYSKIISLRNSLFWDAIKHLRPFLALYHLIMFYPLSRMLRYHWFRSKVFRLEQLAYLLS